MKKMPRTAPRDPSYSTADLKPVIFTPDALPQFADQGHRESLHQKDKRAKKLKPTEPIHGAGKGGRLGSSATQGLVQDIFMKERLMEDVSIFLDEIESELICTASRSLTEVRRQAGRGREEGVIVVHSIIILTCISLPVHNVYKADRTIKPYHHFPCISVPSPGSEHYRV
jgi:hypothetical protein